MEERGVALPEYDPADAASVEAWDNASREMAQNASGTVRAVLGNASSSSTWARIELPTLEANPSVTRILRINPSTGAETVIFSR